MIAHEYRTAFWHDENVLELGRGVVVQHCENTKNPSLLHFKMEDFMASELHVNKK